MVATARFDDLTPGGEQSFEFLGHVDTIVATSLHEVVPAIAALSDAGRRGLWSAGFIAYDAAPAFDPTLVVRPSRVGDPTHGLPLLWFATFEQRAPASPLQPRATYPAGYTVSSWTPDIDAGQWRREIEEIRKRIASGEASQVNHTFRLRAAFAGDPWELYRDVVLGQRGAHAAWLDTGRFQVASASPELFFTIENGRVTTRPMKGTIHRGRWSAEDRELAARLLASEKDRAENLMIVDLLRDDLGRIAEVGSVRADRLLQLERYETVWTLTSDVTAILAAGTELADVFRAIFPSGSVTGTPRPAAMHTIAELEPSPRGVYCGAIGYVAASGASPQAQFNVAIRTVVVDSEEGLAEYGVGGGITWASDAADEYEETRTKARHLAERRPEFDLVEMMRWEPEAGFVLLDRHLDRLEASAAYFGFVFDVDHVRELLDKSVSALHAPMRISLRCNRHGDATVEIDEPLLDPFAENPRGFPVMVAVGEPTIDPGDVFMYHGTTQRSVYEQQRDVHSFAADVVMVNRRGELTESTMANLVLRFGDTWWTPHVGAGLLPGVYREELLARGAIEERVIGRDQMLRADEMALIDSVRGWRRAIVIANDED